MKKLLALSLLAATSAFAQTAHLSSVDMELGNFADTKSTVSRQAVVKEVQRARANGELQYGDKDVYVAPTTSKKTRAQVVKELEEARKSGEFEKSIHIGE